MPKVTNSFEGLQECDRLKADLKNLRYNPDLHKMLRNLEKMVSEISKCEVISRQTHKTHLLESPLNKLNESIQHLDKLIIIAKLME